MTRWGLRTRVSVITCNKSAVMPMTMLRSSSVSASSTDMSSSEPDDEVELLEELEDDEDDDEDKLPADSDWDDSESDDCNSSVRSILETWDKSLVACRIS